MRTLYSHRKWHISSIVFLCTLILTFGISTAHASKTVTVSGTGDAKQDVKNLQKAVDEGGVIKLKGSFDLGSKGRITIKKDVRIEGMTDSIGLPLTVIEGGYRSFHSPLETTKTAPSKAGPSIKITNIHFKGAKGTPMNFAYAGGVHIENVTVSHVKPEDLRVHWNERGPMPFLAGVVIGNRLDHRSKPMRNAISGAVTVKESRFFMDSEKPGYTMGTGVYINWTWGATIVIEDNVIRRASRAAIRVLDNAINQKNEGSITITGNNILTPDDGIHHPNAFTPNGIVAGWYFDTSGGTDLRRNSPITISRNRIEARGDNSAAILLFSNSPVVVCNDILMVDGRKGRGIVQTGSRGFFANNRIRGEAEYGIFVHYFETLKASSNTIAWTDFSEFKAYKGQFLFQGHVNKILGKAKGVVDKGKGNRMLDIKPCSLPGVDADDDWEPTKY